MATDRELLESAARAAGEMRLVPYREEWLVSSEAWNPLTDDGDAMRLFTKLPFRELYASEIGVTVSWRREGSQHGLKCDEYADEHGGDLQAATRRAIVRAAAFIGDGMKP